MYVDYSIEKHLVELTITAESEEPESGSATGDVL